MENQNLSVASILQEGINIGIKNAVPLIGAVLLWIVTIWIPYLNVGTTIAINSIPLELSRGKVISPLFIFDSKYRQFMGEYFTLIGLMSMSLIPAFFFMVVPGIIISIGWSLALYIMLDKKVAPGEALICSNKATQGHKLTIFLAFLALYVVLYIVALVFALLGDFGTVLIILLMIAFSVIVLGCMSVVYRQLVLNADEAQSEANDVIDNTIE